MPSPASACCEQIVGGLVQLYILGGDGHYVYEVVGDVVVSPARNSRTANATSRGTMYITNKPMLATASVDFVNSCLADPLYLVSFGAYIVPGCVVNVSIVEVSRGYRHLFSNAAIVGWPEINLSTGMVSGLQISSDLYTRLGPGGMAA